MTSSRAKRAYLLGPYPGNTHVSINNYFDYCRASAKTYLPDWDFTALLPGHFEPGGFLKSDVSRRQAWKELYLDWPFTLRGLHADVVHIVDQGMAWYRLFLPSGGRSGKTIVTVHDLINVLSIRGRNSFESLPIRRQQMVKLCVSQIKRAEAIVCPSSATAADVARELDIPPSRIHVIFNLIPDVFQPMPESQRCETRKRLFGDARYALLHVGKPTAYKNRLGALKIFECLHAELPDSRMLVTSQSFSAEEEAFLQGSACASAVAVQQPEQQAGLRELYCAADVLLFPSITEGFGWPPVEAMACGCPVVSSTGGSLSEVIGDGAVRIADPLDTSAFARAAIEILKDAHAACHWRKQGLTNSKRFSEPTIGPRLAELYSSLT